MHTPSSSLPLPDSSPNLLLASLPPEDFERLRPMLRTVPLAPKQMLFRKGDSVESIYFPWGAVCSMVANMEDGGMVELATVGPEGVVGYLAAFGQRTSTHDAMIQIPASPERMFAHAMATGDFVEQMARNTGLRDAVHRYAVAAHVFIATSVACNALHTAEERCARWLLMVHDRISSDQFYLSHEFLAMMLGIRRPTATVVAGTLQEAGLIRYHRGKMDIVDREGLENASCECYQVVARHFAGLVAAPS